MELSFAVARLHNARAFLDRDDLIGGNVLDDFRVAIGPANLDLIRTRAVAESEVRARVIERIITRLAADLLHLLPPARFQANTRAYRRTIRFRADQFQRQPVVRATTNAVVIVAQQRRR